MGLDVYLTKPMPSRVFEGGTTHNLTRMADAAGLYDCLWRPDEHGITKAAQLIEPLRAGLAKLEADPAKFKTFDSPNGWGTYDNFVRFVGKYLAACIEHPDADVEASR